MRALLFCSCGLQISPRFFRAASHIERLPFVRGFDHKPLLQGLIKHIDIRTGACKERQNRILSHGMHGKNSQQRVARISQ